MHEKKIGRLDFQNKEDDYTLKNTQTKEMNRSYTNEAILYIKKVLW